MFVLIVLTTLSTLAVVSYHGYVRKARMAHAVDMLAAVRVRQEAYYLTNHQYVDTGDDDQDFHPASIWNANCTPAAGAAFTIDCSDTSNNPARGWCALGITSLPGFAVDHDGSTYFSFLTIGWDPDNNIADPATGCNGDGYCLVTDHLTPWWVAIARGDQRCGGTNDDAENITSVAIMSSQARTIIIDNVNEGDPSNNWGSSDHQSLTKSPNP